MSPRSPSQTFTVVPRADRGKGSTEQWLVPGAVALSIALSMSYGVISLGPFWPDVYKSAVGSDFGHYDNIARNLLDGKGFTLAGQPNIHRAPGFPIWIAGVYALTGRSYTALVAVQILLVGFIVYLTSILARQLGGERAGVLAAYVAAVNPVLIYYSIRPYSEPLFTVLSLLMVITVGPALCRAIWWRVTVAGILAGMACLVRGQMLIIPVFLGLWWLWRLKWRGFSAALAFTLAMWFPISPWTIRNYIVSGHFIPVQIQSGHVLWVSNNDRVLSDPVYWGYNVDPSNTHVKPAGPGSPVEDQVRADQEKREEALHFLRENVEKIPLLVTYKFTRFFSLGTRVELWKKTVLYALDLSLVPVAIGGIVVLSRRGVPALGASLAALLTTLVTVAVFWGDSRFRLTIEPYLIALSAICVLAIWDLVQRVAKRGDGQASRVILEHRPG